MCVVMIQRKVSTRSIHRFKRYRLLNNLTENINILSNADADADAMVTAIALPVLTYRRANKMEFVEHYKQHYL